MPELERKLKDQRLKETPLSSSQSRASLRTRSAKALELCAWSIFEL
jgi:hypothetical protein